jgi:hypothetical protein
MKQVISHWRIAWGTFKKAIRVTIDSAKETIKGKWRESGRNSDRLYEKRVAIESHRAKVTQIIFDGSDDTECLIGIENQRLEEVLNR